MKEKNVPFKNYILLAGILILSIVLVIYFYMWYGTYEDNILNTSIMGKYLNVINYNELDDYLLENNTAIIYVSAANNRDIKIFENKLKKVINDYSLNNSILYLDLSSEIKNDKLYNTIKNNYNFNDIPSLILFRNGTVYDVYDLKDNNYNIDNFILYLMNEGVIND